MPEQKGILPRPEVQNTRLDRHGALDFEELARMRISPDEIIDFSVNSNPFGPSPAVRKAHQAVPIERYPNRESLALRTALAEKYTLELPQIVVGNGTAELLWLVAMAYLRSGDTVLISKPTFGEYARGVALMGAQVQTIWANGENDFTFDAEAIHAALTTSSPRLAFLCNPNNPTGTVLTPETIRGLANAHPNTLFVIDEAYIQFVPELASCLSLGLPNILVLRSMTKDYAIAGLRLGFAAGPADIIMALTKVRPPWNVNAVAQEAGLAALIDDEYLSQTMTRLHAAKTDFLYGLNSLGLHPVPSETHYFIIKVGCSGFSQSVTGLQNSSA